LGESLDIALRIGYYYICKAKQQLTNKKARDNMAYRIEKTGEVFDNGKYLDAIKVANSIGSTIWYIEGNRQVWEPAPPVSAKRLRMQEHRQAAYEAQQRLLERQEKERQQDAQERLAK
jgi:hypothetical protein